MVPISEDIVHVPVSLIAIDMTFPPCNAKRSPEWYLSTFGKRVSIPHTIERSSDNPDTVNSNPCIEIQAPSEAIWNYLLMNYFGPGSVAHPGKHRGQVVVFEMVQTRNFSIFGRPYSPDLPQITSHISADATHWETLQADDRDWTNLISAKKCSDYIAGCSDLYSQDTISNIRTFSTFFLRFDDSGAGCFSNQVIALQPIVISALVNHRCVCFELNDN